MSGERAPPPLMHLAGVPATGKSSFGRWLADEHGYIHVDVEESGRLEALDLLPAWQALERGSIRHLASELRRLGNRVVLDWGFPVGFIEQVRVLGDAGFELWWFDGSDGRAKEAFVRRSPDNIGDFDRQMASIKQNWPEIESLYGSRVLCVIDGSGQHMDPELIWREMLDHDA